jgi:hypothetical protein
LHRRADLAGAFALFFEAVDLLVIGEDDVRVRAELEVGGGDVLLVQAVQLADEDGRIHYHAIGDDAEGVRVEDAAGYEVQLEVQVLRHDGVPGVAPSRIADHDIGLLRQDIDDLPLGLVAPLGADHHNRWHQRVLTGGPALTP